MPGLNLDRRCLTLVTVVAFNGLLTSRWAWSADNSAVHIETTIKTLFDRPGQPVVVRPDSVVGTAGLAGWTQGATGGRALMRFEQGQWVIAACAGDSLLDAKNLRQAGLSPAVADALVRMQHLAESKEPLERVKLFARFNANIARPDAQAGHADHTSGGAKYRP